MEIKVKIPKTKGEGVTAILNGLLSDEYVLYTKARNYHWNVVGPQFNDLHKFFEAQYEALNVIVDEVAERTRTVGGWSLGSLSEFLKYARLKEYPGEHPDARRMLANLLADHESIIRTLRKEQSIPLEDGDVGTNNFLIGLLERHEKMAWMLRSFGEKA